MNIQWYPGHMTKAMRMMAENLKSVDAICEIVDARIPISGRNPDLDDLAKNKTRIIVLNRIDQADTDATAVWARHFEQNAFILKADSKSGRGIDAFPGVVKKALSEKIQKYTQSGQVGRQLRIMVVGIPNVGKSSFINRVAKKKLTKTSDKPGVTRGKQWINLDNGILLLDTPGVLWPKFDSQTVAENLAFTGAIRDEVIDVTTLAANLFSKLIIDYEDRISERYKICEIKNLSGYEILEKAAKKRGFLLPGGEVDIERMAIILLDEFRGGKLGKVTLERVGDRA